MEHPAPTPNAAPSTVRRLLPALAATFVTGAVISGAATAALVDRGDTSSVDTSPVLATDRPTKAAAEATDNAAASRDDVATPGPAARPSKEMGRAMESFDEFSTGASPKIGWGGPEIDLGELDPSWSSTDASSWLLTVGDDTESAVRTLLDGLGAGSGPLVVEADGSMLSESGDHTFWFNPTDGNWWFQTKPEAALSCRNDTVQIGCVTENRRSADSGTVDPDDATIRDLLIAGGFTDGRTYRNQDAYQSWITAEEEIGGRPTGRQWTLTYGPDGTIRYASGYLSQLTPFTTTSLLPLGEAVARYNAVNAVPYEMADPYPMPLPGVIEDSGSVTGDDSGPSTYVPEVGDTGEIFPEPALQPFPMPVDPSDGFGGMAPMGRWTVEAVGAVVQWTMVWGWLDGQSAVAVMPVYQITDRDGGWWTVPATGDPHDGFSTTPPDFSAEGDAGDPAPTPGVATPRSGDMGASDIGR